MMIAKNDGAIAQLVEQRTENPCVPGSIPGGTTPPFIRAVLERGRSFLFSGSLDGTRCPSLKMQGRKGSVERKEERKRQTR